VAVEADREIRLTAADQMGPPKGCGRWLQPGWRAVRRGSRNQTQDNQTSSRDPRAGGSLGAPRVPLVLQRRAHPATADGYRPRHEASGPAAFLL